MPGSRMAKWIQHMLTKHTAAPNPRVKPNPCRWLQCNAPEKKRGCVSRKKCVDIETGGGAKGYLSMPMVRGQKTRAV